MIDKSSEESNSSLIQGMYGEYTITSEDNREVLYYRLSILLCGLFFSFGTTQIFLNNPSQVFICLLGMVISLGLSLKWIHIYLRPLHQSLQFLWVIGCIGLALFLYNFGLENTIIGLTENSKWTILIGPIFATLTGIGFKEFFCFRRFEAIGITIFIPIALIGHISEIIDQKFVFVMLIISSLLLLIMGIRKFDLPPEADIGDKSIFNFLENQRKFKTS